MRPTYGIYINKGIGIQGDSLGLVKRRTVYEKIGDKIDFIYWRIEINRLHNQLNILLLDDNSHATHPQCTDSIEFGHIIYLYTILLGFANENSQNFIILPNQSSTHID